MITMSYRTSVNGVQIFGNNEYYQEWADFLQSEGIEIDEDGLYEGYITNLQGMFNVVDKITRRLIDERHQEIVNGETRFGEPLRELTDLSRSAWLNEKTPLLMWNMEMIRYAYCFLPYQVFKAVEDIIEPSDRPYADDKDWFCCSYKLKEGKQILVNAA